MAPVTSSVKALNAYLKHSKSIFLKHHATRPVGGEKTRRLLHIVMGNEALDLDSTVSSVLLANLYHHYYMDQESLPEQLVAVDVLPVLPIERRDFVLRQDAHALLSRVGVDLQHVLFIDDLSAPSQSVKTALLNCQAAGQLRVTLTDHNLLGQDFSALSPSVVGIVDHHVDQTISEHATLSQERQIVVPLGSATTLVAERYLGLSPLPSLQVKGAEESEFEPTSLLDAAIGNLMIGTILIDTVNLDAKMGRTEPRDIQAIDAIVRHLTQCGDQFGLQTVDERNALFQFLQDTKFDLSRLTSAELLRKDYKSWQVGNIKYGISSVTMSTADWVSKDLDLSATFSQYMLEQHIAFLLVLTSFTDQNQTFNREVMAIAQPGNEALFSHIISAISEPLTLSSVEIPSPLNPSNNHISFFNQKDIKLSRKQVQPAIHAALQGFASRL
jgi:exopolyphosphatase